MLYRRLIAQSIKAARVGPPPAPSGMYMRDHTAAVLRARARLEAPSRPRPAPERRPAAL
jgi:hypothetical protein